MALMSFLKLLAPRGKTIAFLMSLSLACATLSLHPATARADRAPPTRLALSKDPAAPPRPTMVDAPAPHPADPPAAAESSTHRSNWWVWAAVAVAAAGVAALVVTSSGKDPSCPGDRVCR
jgi:hypothetical protein